MDSLNSDKLRAAFCVFILVVHLATAAETTGRGTELAQSLLARVSATRQEVKNFKCTVTYHDFTPSAAQHKRYEELVKAGIPDEKAQRFKNEGTEHRYQEHRLAFDSEGRARVEMIGGSAEPNGVLAIPGNRYISTWDGQNAIEYQQRPERMYGSAILSKKQTLPTK